MIFWHVASASFKMTSRMCSLAPWAANVNAMARPIPLPPPVTTATFPLSLNLLSLVACMAQLERCLGLFERISLEPLIYRTVVRWRPALSHALQCHTGQELDSPPP